VTGAVADSVQTVRLVQQAIFSPDTRAIMAQQVPVKARYLFLLNVQRYESACLI
jgi:hypothetical protein